MLFRKTWVFGWTSKFNQLKWFSPLTIKSFPFIFSLQTISGPSFRRANRERDSKTDPPEAPTRSHPLSPLEAHQRRHLDRHHPKPISSPTHPRPSSFVEQRPKHRWVVPSIPETQKTHSSNPLRRTHHSVEPIRQTHHSDEPIPQTHFSNPHWPPPISLSLSLSHLSPSLTLRCFSDFFCFNFCFFDCLYILILCNNICLYPNEMWETL